MKLHKGPILKLYDVFCPLFYIKLWRDNRVELTWGRIAWWTIFEWFKLKCLMQWTLACSLTFFFQTYFCQQDWSWHFLFFVPFYEIQPWSLSDEFGWNLCVHIPSTHWLQELCCGPQCLRIRTSLITTSNLTHRWGESEKALLVFRLRRSVLKQLYE